MIGGHMQLNLQRGATDRFEEDDLRYKQGIRNNIKFLSSKRIRLEPTVSLQHNINSRNVS